MEYVFPCNTEGVIYETSKPPMIKLIIKDDDSDWCSQHVRYHCAECDEKDYDVKKWPTIVANGLACDKLIKLMTSFLLRCNNENVSHDDLMRFLSTVFRPRAYFHPPVRRDEVIKYVEVMASLLSHMVDKEITMVRREYSQCSSFRLQRLCSQLVYFLKEDFNHIPEVMLGNLEDVTPDHIRLSLLLIKKLSKTKLPWTHAGYTSYMALCKHIQLKRKEISLPEAKIQELALRVDRGAGYLEFIRPFDETLYDLLSVNKQRITYTIFTEVNLATLLTVLEKVFLKNNSVTAKNKPSAPSTSKGTGASKRMDDEKGMLTIEESNSMLQHISFLDYGPILQDQPENPANTYNNSDDPTTSSVNKGKSGSTNEQQESTGSRKAPVVVQRSTSDCSTGDSAEMDTGENVIQVEIEEGEPEINDGEEDQSGNRNAESNEQDPPSRASQSSQDAVENEDEAQSDREEVQNDEEMADTDKDGADTDKDGADMDKDGADIDKDDADTDEDDADMDKDGADSDKDGADSDKDGADSDKDGADSDKDDADIDQDGADSDKEDAQEAESGKREDPCDQESIDDEEIEAEDLDNTKHEEEQTAGGHSDISLHSGQEDLETTLWGTGLDPDGSSLLDSSLSFVKAEPLDPSHAEEENKSSPSKENTSEGSKPDVVVLDDEESEIELEMSSALDDSKASSTKSPVAKQPAASPVAKQPAASPVAKQPDSPPAPEIAVTATELTEAGNKSETDRDTLEDVHEPQIPEPMEVDVEDGEETMRSPFAPSVKTPGTSKLEQSSPVTDTTIMTQTPAIEFQAPACSVKTPKSDGRSQSTPAVEDLIHTPTNTAQSYSASLRQSKRRTKVMHVGRSALVRTSMNVSAKMAASDVEADQEKQEDATELGCETMISSPERELSSDDTFTPSLSVSTLKKVEKRSLSSSHADTQSSENVSGPPSLSDEYTPIHHSSARRSSRRTAGKSLVKSVAEIDEHTESVDPESDESLTVSRTSRSRRGKGSDAKTERRVKTPAKAQSKAADSTFVKLPSVSLETLPSDCEGSVVSDRVTRSRGTKASVATPINRSARRSTNPLLGSRTSTAKKKSSRDDATFVCADSDDSLVGSRSSATLKPAEFPEKSKSPLKSDSEADFAHRTGEVPVPRVTRRSKQFTSVRTKSKTEASREEVQKRSVPTTEKSESSDDSYSFISPKLAVATRWRRETPRIISSDESSDEDDAKLSKSGKKKAVQLQASKLEGLPDVSEGETGDRVESWVATRRTLRQRPADVSESDGNKKEQSATSSKSTLKPESKSGEMLAARPTRRTRNDSASSVSTNASTYSLRTRSSASAVKKRRSVMDPVPDESRPLRKRTK